MSDNRKDGLSYFQLDERCVILRKWELERERLRKISVTERLEELERAVFVCEHMSDAAFEDILELKKKILK